MKTKIVILGGGYAGLMALSRLKKVPNTEIILIDKKEVFTQRIRFHEILKGEDVKTFSYAPYFRSPHTQFIKNEVISIDGDKKEIQLRDRLIPYDYLIYALGSKSLDNHFFKGLEYAIHFDSIHDLKKLSEKLDSNEEKKLFILGAGATGIEAAVEIAEHFPHVKVVVVEKGEAFLKLGKAAAEYLRKKFKTLNIELLESKSIQEIFPKKIEFADGDSFEVDFCLNCLGFVASPLATLSKMSTNDKNQILVDDYLRSLSHPNIFAAGDAAEFMTPKNPKIRMSCATALPMGMYAGETLASMLMEKKYAPFKMGYAAQCLSLGRKDGLVVLVDLFDRPTGKIITGKIAAWIKEFICRVTFYIPRLQLKTTLPLYKWPVPKN